ncbi:MAG TPA: 2,3-bisphosphoglycerate-independent phosphoglycerate mutase [Chitinophagales bacterium]|nr:2,3-bisphosphoglycerate-independent phosphoglycerate mutase [Chitinophagales bacterium]
MLKNDKVMLIILDGWGINHNPAISAIEYAQTPYMDSLLRTYPNNTLITHSEMVGLPDGQMGNSEVGHLNIGAGRIVYQELLRINRAFSQKTIDHNATLLAALQYAQTHQKAVHLLGLVSDGGVHSHINHLKGLCDICEQHQLPQVYIHAIMDGRDTDPKAGIQYLQNVQQHIAHQKAKIASVCGRYYAMDRDKRWERIQLAYDLYTKGKGKPTTDPIAAIQESYDSNITDEFILPIVCTQADGKALATIQPDDVVICFNFRTDRCRQITRVLTQTDMPQYNMHTLPLYYVTMTNYDDTFKNIHIIFDSDNLKNTLGEVLEQHQKRQIRIAETEKYPHVTFFFSGGREQPFEGETRLMANSPKVATYDLQPQMSAPEVTQLIRDALSQRQADFVCLNFANTDMVGHTGVFSAAVKAAETVDECLQKVVETALFNGYVSIVIADHGNADTMINPDGTPNTAHTMNPVPIVVVAPQHNYSVLSGGKLADIAPTILHIMDIPVPSEMTGQNLVV